MSREKVMTRFASVFYGVASYLFFLVTFLYAIGFVSGLVVPKTLDSGPSTVLTEAILINLAVLAVFAIQHSLMARPQFKRWWTTIVPPSVERPTYVLFATAALALLIWQWRAMPEIVWQVTNPILATALVALSLLGWLIVLLSTFMISHFELFGLKQVLLHFRGRQLPAAEFKTPGFYRFVRHPIYFGFLVAFWSTPVMTQGHLLFAFATTAYILIGIMLEERDLVGLFGDEYRRYRERVSMLLPFWRRS
ncbi:hypothetical protein ASE66_09535 [Bosea sp. Root483D1]|nr:hypothetical protein ASE66_09535 [Bosea sp. Root483D1]